jgi:hypothetical protein
MMTHSLREPWLLYRSDALTRLIFRMWEPRPRTLTGSTCDSGGDELRPVAIVMTVGPYDLQHLKDPPQLPDGPKPPRPFDLVNRARESR